MEHQEGQFAGEQGVTLYYQCWRPDGEPRAALVIVHGYGEHSGRYRNVVAHLVPLGYAVYSFDLRGHGRSPGRRGHVDSWDEFLQDVKAFIALVEDREPGRPLFLYGHSMGGLIALEYGLNYPAGLRGVIASGPALLQTGVSPALVFLSRILSRIMPRLGINTGLDPAGVSRDPAVVQAYRDDPLVHSMATPRFGTEMTAAQERTLAGAAGWTLPLLMVHGGADLLVPPEASCLFFDQVTISDKQRIEYEGGFHEPHNDTLHPQLTADLARWLEQHSE